jgi:hypothetical protein
MGEGIEPHIIAIDEGHFDFVLLTSDGAHGAPPDTLDLVVRHATDNVELIRRIIGLSEVLGGRDNSTALVMPTRPQESVININQGRNLSFWSAADRFEVWQPDFSREFRPSSSINSPIDSISEPRNRAGTKVRGKKYRMTIERDERYQQNKPGSFKPEQELPLTAGPRAGLDVQFPKDSED